MVENLSVEANMSNTNRVRAWLSKLPSKAIEFESIGPIVRDIGLEYSQVRGTLKYLENQGEIRIIRETTVGGRQFMRGIELIKIVSSNDIMEQTSEKMKQDMIPVEFHIDESKIPLLTTYLKQKIAVSHAAELLREAGLTDAANTLVNKNMDDEFFNEGVYLLQQIEFLVMNLTSISKQRDDAVIDMQKEREKADYWKSKINTLPENQRSKFEAGAPWMHGND
jgi:DNA-binding transcriptional ArsR family regulator